MKYLLDTHALIWFFSGNPKLSDRVRTLMENEEETKLISLASVWEMAIKQSRKKLTLSLPLERYIKEKLKLQDFELLPITLEHLAQISILPFYHNDPFDRLLIVQAITENIPIVSLDVAFAQYKVEHIWD